MDRRNGPRRLRDHDDDDNDDDDDDADASVVTITRSPSSSSLKIIITHFDIIVSLVSTSCCSLILITLLTLFSKPNLQMWGPFRYKCGAIFLILLDCTVAS